MDKSKGGKNKTRGRGGNEKLEKQLDQKKKRSRGSTQLGKTETRAPSVSTKGSNWGEKGKAPGQEVNKENQTLNKNGALSAKSIWCNGERKSKKKDLARL